MAGKLNNNLMIRTLASDLGLRPSDDPVGEIIKYCHKRVAKFLADFPHCENPIELLKVVADQLRTEFREIRSDEELRQVRTEFLDQGEAGFVSIHKELDGEVLGITLKRLNPQPWDLSFVSLIDCRGNNSYRAYYTKWHELVHLLTLTDQSRLVFRRTHTPNQPKTPEEALVDVVAGTLAFYPAMVRAHAKGAISFEQIEQLRSKLCPLASHQSALLGISKSWPTACILLEARLAHKAGELDPYQQSFSFKKIAPPVLRAVHVNANDAARKLGIKAIPNFRVPPKSVIHHVFREQLPYAEAIEELSWWTSSGGTRWGAGPVIVRARFRDDSVQALLIPVASRNAKAVPA
jgi:hypothetical protein